MKETISLSHSKLSDFNKCKRFYYLRHIELIFPRSKKASLRFGGIFHKAIEDLYKGESISSIQNNIKHTIDSVDRSFFEQKDTDALNWSETVLSAAVDAWMRKFYTKDIEGGIEFVQLEKKYKGLGIFNPDSTKKSIRAKFSFISDMVIRKDGKLWLVEYKTAAQIGDDYISRLDIDSQVSAYIFYLEQELGEKIEGIIYRVLKKPGIRLKKNETPTQFYIRLGELFTEKSDEYLMEYVFHRSKEEIADFRSDLWQEAQYVLSAHRSNTWPRNTQSCVMYGRCEYFPICKKQPRAEMMFKKGEDRNAAN